MDENSRIVLVFDGFLVGENACPAETRMIRESGARVYFLNSKGMLVEKTEKAYRQILEKGLNKPAVDVVAFSQGAAVATVLISEFCLSNVRRLLLVNPAGLIGEDTPWQLFCRFVRQAFGDWQRARRINDREIKEMYRKVSRTFLKNCLANFFHLWRDISEMAQLDLVPYIQKVRDLGVEVVLLTAKSDFVFPLQRLKKTIHGRGYYEDCARLPLVNAWEFFPRNKASHAAPLLERPGIINEILTR